mmetsp:Transcript_15829/g.41667  ORF Transcript_15829/g.41667 Transcript_15829/m.41667 type:complete len:308 (-) Transcript_15829:340-1263(-)
MCHVLYARSLNSASVVVRSSHAENWSYSMVSLPSGPSSVVKSSSMTSLGPSNPSVCIPTKNSSDEMRPSPIGTMIRKSSSVRGPLTPSSLSGSMGPSRGGSAPASSVLTTRSTSPLRRSAAVATSSPHETISAISTIGLKYDSSDLMKSCSWSFFTPNSSHSCCENTVWLSSASASFLCVICLPLVGFSVPVSSHFKPSGAVLKSFRPEPSRMSLVASTKRASASLSDVFIAFVLNTSPTETVPEPSRSNRMKSVLAILPKPIICTASVNSVSLSSSEPSESNSLKRSATLQPAMRHAYATEKRKYS